MVFKKGQNPWNKGKKVSSETSKKISEAMFKQYKDGTRNGADATKKAHETLRTKGHYKRDNSYLYGEKNVNWKGGRNITNSGYVRIRKFGGYILEHRFIWEQSNGEIPKGFQIHHINENKQDNRIENLQLLSNSEHQKLHLKQDEKGRFC
ncbi:HNH endonuclease [Candidatus Woesearchaeota archaeon]|jgi:hypothetical protein|nr:HNH endonuclease [Candidatus Woesearchaeota archaeon]